jgi:thioredoxin-like negative regulator of GroEL
MERVTDIATLQRLKQHGALVILFGGESCNVCRSLRPRLRLMLEQDFPDIRGVYVDCGVSPEICAQFGVFTLPVVKAFIEGMMIADEVGVFSIGELKKTLDRPYTMWQSS